MDCSGPLAGKYTLRCWAYATDKGATEDRTGSYFSSALIVTHLFQQRTFSTACPATIGGRFAP
jgi:hypothetical protein